MVNSDQAINPTIWSFDMLPKIIVPENVIKNNGANISKDQTDSWLM